MFESSFRFRLQAPSGACTRAPPPGAACARRTAARTAACTPWSTWSSGTAGRPGPLTLPSAVRLRFSVSSSVWHGRQYPGACAVQGLPALKQCRLRCACVHPCPPVLVQCGPRHPQSGAIESETPLGHQHCCVQSASAHDSLHGMHTANSKWHGGRRRDRGLATVAKPGSNISRILLDSGTSPAGWKEDGDGLAFLGFSALSKASDAAQSAKMPKVSPLSGTQCCPLWRYTSPLSVVTLIVT